MAQSSIVARRRTWVMPALVVACAVGAFALRHTGRVPYGSDNDEYLLVAHTLLQRGQPTVAGIERTKYPLGLPVILAGFEAAGLPPAATWFAVEAVLVLVIAAMATWLAARALAMPFSAPVPCVAGILCATSYALWHRAGTVMTDVAFTTTFLAALVVEARLGAGRRRFGPVLGLTALAVLAVSLRTVGLVLAVAASLALLVPPRTRRLAWLPAMAAALLVLATHHWLSAYPVHTTGYLRTFFLRDPFDEALGRVGLLGVLGRIPGGLATLLGDAGRAILGWRVPILGVLVLALPVVALVRLRSRLGGAFVLGYLAVLSVWPYHSPRFGLPLVPLAGIGFAVVLGAAARRLRPAVAVPVVVAAVLGLAVPQVRRLHRLGRWERHHLAVVDGAARDVAARLARLPFEAASFDYRELTRRAGRVVLPLPYTHDVRGVLARLRGRGVGALVLTPHHHDARGRYGRLLLAAVGAGGTRIYDDGVFEILRLAPPPATLAPAPRGPR